MIIPFIRKRSQEGSVLFAALFIASILILFLFYYLNLIRAQNVAVARSQAWNGALSAAEAGVEEALAHLNPGAAAPAVDRSANGWGLPQGGFYGPQTRVLGANNKYSVLFSAWTPVTILSTGAVTIPSLGATLTRVVQVVTTNVPLFATSLAAKYNITMNGNNVATDSFDSANPALSTNGKYDSHKASTNGDVASLYGFVSVGNADIAGNLYLGTNADFSVNRNGSVSGKVYHDFNVDFPDVVIPNPPTGWLSPPGKVTIGGTTYDYGFTNVNTHNGYYAVPLTDSSISVYVGPNVKVQLKVSAKNLTLTALRIAGTATTSGNLTFYLTDKTLTVSGNTTVDSGSATNLTIFGATNSTAITFTGNSSFTGTIYAPSADLTLAGSGGNGNGQGNNSPANVEFIGASVTKTVTMNGNYNFHFDENLLRGQFNRGYIVTSWREL